MIRLEAAPWIALAVVVLAATLVVFFEPLIVKRRRRELTADDVARIFRVPPWLVSERPRPRGPFVYGRLRARWAAQTVLVVIVALVERARDRRRP